MTDEELAYAMVRTVRTPEFDVLVEQVSQLPFDRERKIWATIIAIEDRAKAATKHKAFLDYAERYRHHFS